MTNRSVEDFALKCFRFCVGVLIFAGMFYYWAILPPFNIFTLPLYSGFLALAGAGSWVFSDLFDEWMRDRHLKHIEVDDVVMARIMEVIEEEK